MAKIKPGILCWLTRTHAPSNEGLVVTVVERYTGWQSPFHGDGTVWTVRSSEPVHLIVRYQNGEVQDVTGDEFNAAEWQLIPINDPDAQTDDVRDLELQE